MSSRQLGSLSRMRGSGEGVGSRSPGLLDSFCLKSHLGFRFRREQGKLS